MTATTPNIAPAFKFPPDCALCGREMVKADTHPAGYVAFQCGPHDDGNMNVNLVKTEDAQRRQKVS